MPNLLFVTPYFPPSAASGSFRALGFAKHLPKHDWDITIIASGPRPWESEDLGLAREVPRSTVVHYVDFPLQRVRRLWPQVLQRLGIKGCTDLWNSPALETCHRVIKVEKPDVILTTGPPHNVHLIGRALKTRYKIPWVADFRDPWCSWGNETPYVNRIFLLERVWERSVFRHANAIIGNTANAATMFRDAFPKAADRIVAIPNGFDPTEFAIETETKSQDYFLLLHTGVIYAGRNPRPLAEALRRITKNGALGAKQPLLRMLGQCLDGNLRRDLESAGLLDWVDLADPVPHLEASKAARCADLLVLLDSPGRRIGVPAKLYEYIGARRPILAFAEAGSDSTIVLQKCGLPYQVVSNDQDISCIQKAILRLAADSKSVNLNEKLPDFHPLTRQANARMLSDLLKSVIS